jgi:hypothetical protein
MRRAFAVRSVWVVILGVMTSVLVHGQGRAGGPPQAASPGAQARPATGVLIGRVVESDGTTPVAGAVVRLSGGGIGQAGNAFNAASGSGPRAVEVSASGQFLFTGLPKGSYNLDVNAAGFLPGEYGLDHPRSPIPRALDISRSVDLAENETKSDITIRMWRLGVISGTVLDENGQPFVGADVHVTAVNEIWIGRISANVFTATTDDRGSYRAEVAPGDYIVGVGTSIVTMPTQMADQYTQDVSDPAGFQASYAQFTSNGLMPPPPIGLRLGDLFVGAGYQSHTLPWIWAEGDHSPVFVYPSTYYPSASLSTMATLVSVGAGTERGGIDLQMKPEQAFRVSGRLVGPGGAVGGVGVRLVGADANTKTNSPSLFTQAAATDATGAFTFVGVTAGQYTVEAAKNAEGSRQIQTMTVATANGASTMSILSAGASNSTQDPVLWASEPLTVAGADVTDVALSLAEGPRISGRFEFAPGSGAPTPEQIRAIGVGLRVQPGTVAGRLFPVSVLNTATDDGVMFHTSALVPGTYILTANRLPPGWFLRSAVTNGKDAADAPIDISAAGITDLVMTFTNKTTTLSGAVTGDDTPTVPGFPPPSPTVVIFSTNQSLWPKVALSPRTLRSLSVGNALTYKVTGMPAGEYYVAASSSIADFTDARVLAVLSRTASRVTLVEGESRTQDVRAVIVPATIK